MHYEDFGSLEDLATALRQPYVYAGRYSRHRGRVHGRPADDVAASRFIISAQNHDQVGNRAAGERLGHLVSAGRLKIAAALTLTSPFVPMLFQGEEWAASSPFLYFTSHEEELGRLVREGRRQEFAAFGWDPLDVPDPQDPSSFERSRLVWRELAEGAHADVLEWYRALIALRRSTPALLDGTFAGCRVEVSEPAVICLQRGTIRVLCNLGPADRTLPTPGEARTLLASEPGACLSGGTALLPPDSALLVSTQG